MKYKAYINGQPYRMYRGSDGYNMNTYIEALVFVTCFYDDAYFSPNMAVDVDGVVHYPDQNGRLTILGEKGTSKTLALTYDGKTQYIDVTFDGGTYEARYTSGLETLTFTITGVENETITNYIDCTTLKKGTWRCVLGADASDTSATVVVESFTVPLPDSINQALMFSVSVIYAIIANVKASVFYYYDTTYSAKELGTYEKFVGGSEGYSLTFTLSRTGD